MGIVTLSSPISVFRSSDNHSAVESSSSRGIAIWLPVRSWLSTVRCSPSGTFPTAASVLRRTDDGSHIQPDRTVNPAAPTRCAPPVHRLDQLFERIEREVLRADQVRQQPAQERVVAAIVAHHLRRLGAGKVLRLGLGLVDMAGLAAEPALHTSVEVVRPQTADRAGQHFTCRRRCGPGGCPAPPSPTPCPPSEVDTPPDSRAGDPGPRGR